MPDIKCDVDWAVIEADEVDGVDDDEVHDFDTRDLQVAIARTGRQVKNCIDEELSVIDFDETLAVDTFFGTWLARQP